MKPNRLLIILLAVLAFAATACSSGDSDSDGGSSPDDSGTGQDISSATTEAAPDETGLEITRGGEISVGIVAESSGWYPPSAETAFSAGFLVMDALYDRWYDQTGGGELIPVVAAARATPNDDASEWTMPIRPGIMFHDGTEVNAQAAVDMITQWHEGPFGSSSTIDRAEVVDEYTVRYFLTGPDPAFEEVLAGIATGAVFSPTAGRAFGPEDSVDNPIGTGPFMFESWIRDSEVVVVRNPNYWRSAPDGGTLPYLDRIRFRVLPDGTARRASLEAGDLDMATQGGPDGGPALIEQGFVPYEFIGNGAALNIYNTAVPPFDDVRMRRAAAHALDPEQANALRPPNLSGVAEFRTQYYNSSSRWYDEAAGEGYARFDPDEAQRLYDEYINDPGRSDGKSVGEPVSFTYDCNTDPINLDTAQLFQQEWGDVGFEVEIRTTEQASFVNQIIGTSSEPLFQGDFQIACWADGSEQDPLSIYRTRYGSNQVLNWTNFTDPAIDAALETLRTSLDFDTRKAAAADIARITADAQTVYWWASGSTLVLGRPEVHGVENFTYPDGQVGERRGSGRVWWHEVWLEGAEPLDDVPTGFVEIPEVTTTTTTEAPAEPVPGGPDPAIADAMPAAPPGLRMAGNGPPLADLCPGITTLEGIEPISATSQSYPGDPQLGPNGQVTIYVLEPGDADTIIGRYEQAVAECVEFSTELDDGTPVNLGYVSRDLGSFGPESYGYGVAGDAGGFPIDSDIVLIRSGDNLALVTALHILSPADGSVVTPLAEGA
ncbi:MAG: ABC transporter substrate-binding protein, partial [Acidimicrobiales bacterium]|nr:ABC transporter substrate-binding protein [Acidimicrobiales bacterium]